MISYVVDIKQCRLHGKYFTRFSCYAICIFALLCDASKGFIKPFKAFWGTTKKYENKNVT